MTDGCILHVDLDAFYASVEQLLDPSLRGRPVLVGEGVVLAASYEARAHGVVAPMSTRRARLLCPQAVVVRGSFSRYADLSRQVMHICRDFTPLVEQVSIDEAFLDVSGSVHLLGPPPEIGGAVRRRVREEVGLPISVGIAGTKFLAKVASGQAKPDGLLTVPAEREVEWLHALPVEVMWGVGPTTARRLREVGIERVGDVARAPVDALSRRAGRAVGARLHALAWNRDRRRVTPRSGAGSVGAQQALGAGSADPAELATILLGLADRVGGRMRAKGRTARTVTVRVRFADMGSVTRSSTRSTPASSTSALHHLGVGLLEECLRAGDGPATLLALSVSHLEPEGPLELELPLDPGHPARPGSSLGHAHLLVDLQIDRIRERYGRQAVGRTSLLLGTRRSVPDDFRKLSERE